LVGNTYLPLEEVAKATGTTFIFFFLNIESICSKKVNFAQREVPVAFDPMLLIWMLGKMVEKQKVEILKMVERTKGRIAKCRNYY
jgi:hypothetical protein